MLVLLLQQCFLSVFRDQFVLLVVAFFFLCLNPFSPVPHLSVLFIFNCTSCSVPNSVHLIWNHNDQFIHRAIHRAFVFVSTLVNFDKQVDQLQTILKVLILESVEGQHPGIHAGLQHSWWAGIPPHSNGTPRSVEAQPLNPQDSKDPPSTLRCQKPKDSPSGRYAPSAWREPICHYHSQFI